jgi:hypothetical protein
MAGVDSEALPDNVRQGSLEVLRPHPILRQKRACEYHRYGFRS